MTRSWKPPSLAVGAFGLATIGAVALATREVGTTFRFAAGVMVAVLLVEAARNATAVAPEAELRNRSEEAGATGVLLSATSTVSARRSAWDVHTRIRPRLREVAAPLLRHRRGLDLDDARHADEIRAVVGPTAWELIRPDRSPPAKRLARGMSARELRTVLAGIEEI